ncbi:uncharacterized protein LOC119162974 isoform X4 [Rhipicephalus microplus]|uniref:uncharacterized protein LOC119162974 isoform X4 n=1 Tax=Rhipicephalus microplus TaxID=6941 RepID=UPI003F6D400F
MTVENLCVCSRSPRTLQEELSGLRLFTVRTSHQESDQWQKRLHHWQLRCTLERLYQAELRHQMLHPVGGMSSTAGCLAHRQRRWPGLRS